MRDTSYATELAHADIGGHRIERLHVKHQGQEEIRFSWWKDGRMAMRPLDLPEHELLPLLRKAIENGVFTEGFLRELHSLLYEARGSVRVPGQGE